ncbi:hypothetical protein L0938_00575 [Paracidovorax citrulli]
MKQEIKTSKDNIEKLSERASPSSTARIRAMKLQFRDRTINVVKATLQNGTSDFLQGRKYALLLPVLTLAEKKLSSELAETLGTIDCIEICCVGPLASELEDDLDFALEQNGTTDIATTSFQDKREALEYFLFATGGADPSLCLVAAIEDHPDMTETLISLTTPK